MLIFVIDSIQIYPYTFHVMRKNPGYRVVYGETRPAWEKIFPTLREALAFAKKHESMGDVIFSIREVVPGEPPQSIMAAIDAEAE